MIAQGPILETKELERSPFADVIADYRKHARRVVEHKPRPKIESRRFRRKDIPVTKQKCVNAVIYYLGTAQQLERL